MTSPSKTNPFLVIVSLLWASAVCAGLRAVLNYEYTPGLAAIAPAEWPLDTTLRLAPDRATLVLFGHPHCPCTRASLGELARIMTQCHGKVMAYVLFYKPADLDEGWEKTDLWRSARSMTDVSVIQDVDGVEADRFHAATSGQAMLYDPRGHLLFMGGITESRGHYGDNDGRDAIVSLLTSGSAKQTRTPVFGCSLLDEKSERGEEAHRCHK